MAKLNSKWIALTSLFYDGEISCKIEINDYAFTMEGRECKEICCNIHSLIHVQKFFEECNFKKFKYTQFEIDVDLPEPQERGFGTYTEKLEDGRRLQISGPLLMPWYFVSASK